MGSVSVYLTDRQTDKRIGKGSVPKTLVFFMPRAPSTYTSNSPKGILLHSKKLWMRVLLPYYLSPIIIIMPPMVLIYERSSGSPPPPPPPVSLNPGINDLMTSSSSNHDFHLQTPLSTTTTTAATTTPPFKTEESFCSKEFKKYANDGWMGGSPNLSLSVSLSLSLSLSLHLQESYNHFYFFLFYFFL